MDAVKDWYFVYGSEVKTYQNAGEIVLTPTVYGYTDNEWFARQFYKQLYENKLFLTTGEDISLKVDMVSRRCTLGQFSDFITSEFSIIITGEDIIQLFPLDQDDENSKMVLTTMDNALYDQGFSGYIDRFLVPTDQTKIADAVIYCGACMKFIKDKSARVNLYVLFDNLINSPFLTDEQPISTYLNIIKYGVWKGWYKIV